MSSADCDGSVREGELHLRWERNGVGTGTCSVGSVFAILKDVADQREVLVLFVRGAARWHRFCGRWGALLSGR
jgi:hypothetical protein